MASDAPVEETADSQPFRLFQEPDRQVQRARWRLGLWNGALLGLAVALGIWGTELLVLFGVPFAGRFVPALLGLLTLTLTGAAIGWLTARCNQILLTAILWLLATALWAILAGHLPYAAFTWYGWLQAPGLWGVPLFPYSGGLWGALVVAGLLTHIVLVVLALLQEYRLEGIQGALHADRKLNRRAWLLLLWPLPLVFLATLAPNLSGEEQLWRAPRLVHEAIETGRSHQGDLFALSRQEGINYNAVAGIRDQLTGDYSLQLGEILPEMATVIIVAQFDSGAWINCRVLAGNLNFCYDVAPIYFDDLAAAVAGQPPADCPNCSFRDDGAWRNWLHERQPQLGPAPTISKLLQQGNYVLMRLESPQGDYAVQCRLRGLNSVHLEWCEES